MKTPMLSRVSDELGRSVKTHRLAIEQSHTEGSRMMTL